MAGAEIRFARRHFPMERRGGLYPGPKRFRRPWAGLSNPGIEHFSGYFQDIVKTAYSGFPGWPSGDRQEGRQEGVMTMALLNIMNKTLGVLNLAS